MESIAQKAIELLPKPLFGAIALICIVAWLWKETKGLKRVGQVFNFRSFQLFSGIILAGVVIYYSYLGFRLIYPAAEFDRSERGIAVFAIERDDNNAVQAQIYESIKLAFATNQFPSDLRVKRNSLKFGDASDEVIEYCRKINATVCTWGSFVPPTTVFMTAVLTNDPKLPARAQLSDFHHPDDFIHQLLQLASRSLPAASSDPVVPQFVQDKIKSLEKLQGALANRINTLESRLADLEFRSDENKILVSENKRRRLGLFIGISDYAFAPRLRYASLDARSMHQVGKSLWPNTEFSLYDSEVTQSAIFSAMERLNEQANVDDQVWIYLSGHTLMVDGRAYFLPFDVDATRPLSIKMGAIPFDEIKNWFVNLRAKQAIAFIDTCYSGALLPAQLPRGVEVVPSKWVAGAGRVIFTATGPNELAFEDEKLGHGLFTAALLDGLENGAAIASSVVTEVDLCQFMMAKILTYEVRGVKQIPSMYSTLTSGAMALAPNKMKR